MTCRARSEAPPPPVEVTCPLAELEAGLCDPAAWPEPVKGPVEVVHTHISVVFLAGDQVLKLKKPLRLPFLDAASLERRRSLCEAEVALNARLAPGVYRGVLPLVRTPQGLRVGAQGTPVEYAVHMRRLPPEWSLRALVARDAVDTARIWRLGARIASFHTAARRGPEVAAFGTFAAVSALLRENLEELGSLPDPVVSPALLAALTRRTEEELARLEPLIEARARRGLTVDGHGDLRLEHVYFCGAGPAEGFDPRLPACEQRPQEPLVIDCVEFSERIRCCDPAADVAFLVMELTRAGRPDLARTLAEAAFAPRGDLEARQLLPLYVSYRAAVRAKVDAISASTPSLPPEQRAERRARARSEALLALSTLSPPPDRPCLVLLCGLPGTGKSVLARALAERHGLTWIRSDAVRKELAGVGAATSARAGADQGIYTPEFSQRTYAACLERAEAVWQDGGRALVDANFPSEERRLAFLQAAARDGVPARVLWLTVPPEVARERIAGRRGDASDADLHTYELLRARFEAPGPETTRALVRVDASSTPEVTLATAEAALRVAGLL